MEDKINLLNLQISFCKAIYLLDLILVFLFSSFWLLWARACWKVVVSIVYVAILFVRFHTMEFTIFNNVTKYKEQSD